MRYYYCYTPKGTRGSRRLKLQDWIRRVSFEPDSTVVVEGSTEREALHNIIKKLTENDTFIVYDYACLGESFCEAYYNVLEIIECGTHFNDCALGLFNYGETEALFFLKTCAGMDDAMHDATDCGSDMMI